MERIHYISVEQWWKKIVLFLLVVLLFCGNFNGTKMFMGMKKSLRGLPLHTSFRKAEFFVKKTSSFYFSNN